jgi:hypothetical protein
MSGEWVPDMTVLGATLYLSRNVLMNEETLPTASFAASFSWRMRMLFAGRTRSAAIDVAVA